MNQIKIDTDVTLVITAGFLFALLITVISFFCLIYGTKRKKKKLIHYQ